MSLLTTRALLTSASINTSAQKYATTEPTERQRIGNQIDAAFILARGALRKRASLIASVMRHSITKSC